jgi:hypothetical protein
MDIFNNNSKNCPPDYIYNSFNEFIFLNDIKLLGKLLHRFEYFNKVKDLPGDIIEIGVFKGSGIATFSKFLEIYCPNSNKKIIGFDIFQKNTNEILSKDIDLDKTNMNAVLTRVNLEDLTLESVENRLINMNIHKKFSLIEGDVEETLPIFLEKNPGLRISLLYIDCDIERPTYVSLKYLWDRLLPGGVIVFDEFQFHKFSESNGFDTFIKEFIAPRTTPITILNAFCTAPATPLNAVISLPTTVIRDAMVFATTFIALTRTNLNIGTITLPRKSPSVLNTPDIPPMLGATRSIAEFIWSNAPFNVPVNVVARSDTACLNISLLL